MMDGKNSLCYWNMALIFEMTRENRLIAKFLSEKMVG